MTWRSVEEAAVAADEAAAEEEEGEVVEVAADGVEAALVGAAEVARLELGKCRPTITKVWPRLSHVDLLVV